MIWFAWRQFRTQVLVVVVLLVTLSIVLAVNGSHLLHLYDTSVLPCTQHSDCGSVTQNFESQAKWNHALDVLMLAAPALIGIFWGAPLIAREIESRTNQLAWTQSVTRSSWFIVKVVLVGSGTVIASGLLSLMITWWAGPYDALKGSPYSVFDQRDIVPVAYALFAFALGVTAGVLIRRTLPAMATTLAVFVGVRIGFGSWIRPRLIAPLHATGVFTIPTVQNVFTVPSSVGPSDWLLSEEVVTSTGRVIGQNGAIGPNGAVNFTNTANGGVAFDGVGPCPNRFPSLRPVGQSTPLNTAMQRCADSFHLRTIVTYQPQSRYWAFQWTEAAIFGVGTVALIVLSLWWVRRRIV